jgi:hypothetical protein
MRGKKGDSRGGERLIYVFCPQIHWMSNLCLISCIVLHMTSLVKRPNSTQHDQGMEKTHLTRDEGLLAEVVERSDEVTPHKEYGHSDEHGNANFPEPNKRGEKKSGTMTRG